MLIQSPPMQAAGKSHSSMSVGKEQVEDSRADPKHSQNLPKPSPPAQSSGLIRNPTPYLEAGWVLNLARGSGGGRYRPVPWL